LFVTYFPRLIFFYRVFLVCILDLQSLLLPDSVQAAIVSFSSSLSTLNAYQFILY